MEASAFDAGEPVGTFYWTDAAQPSQAVVTATADAADAELAALPQLQDVVDPDALNDLFAEWGYGGGRLDGTVRFEYHEYLVVLKGNGRGYLYDASALDDSNPIDRSRPSTAGHE